MLEFSDDSALDAQLRETPLPERFLERLHAALWTTDEVIDEQLGRIAPPSTLFARLREIPEHEPVDDALCDVEVPGRLMSRLRATAVSLRRHDSRMHLARELATAAALLVAVSLGLTAGGYFWLGPTLSGFIQQASAPQTLYTGPLLVQASYSEAEELPSVSIQEIPTAMMLVDWQPPPQEELSVELPEEQSLPEIGPVGQWLAAQASGLNPWDSWVHLRWGVLGARHDDRDDGITLEDFPRAPVTGLEPPPTRGYNRNFWLTHHVYPPMSPAVESLRSFAAPLTTERDGIARWEQLIAGGRKPSAKEIRVEEFAAAVTGSLPDLPPGKLSLIATGGPSPFGPPQSALLQLLAAGGPAAIARAPRHTVVALDLSASMARRNWSAGQRSLAGLTEKLQPNDRLSLVAFREEVDLSLENISANDGVEWREAIRRLKPEGGADLAAGLRAAATLAMNGDRGTAAELLVLTDHEAPLSVAVRPGMVELLQSAIAAGVKVRWFHLGAAASAADEIHLPGGTAREAGADVATVDGVRGALAAWERKLATPIASDVQARVDFNPKVVAAYRLIGQEAGSWSRSETTPPAIDVRSGEAGQCLFELVFAGSDADVGTVTFTWRDPASGQTQRVIQPLSRSTFASQFSGAPGHWQRACLAAEAGEVLRGSRDALRDIGWTGKETHDLAAVLAYAKNVSGTVREEAEFARLLQLLENYRRK